MLSTVIDRLQLASIAFWYVLLDRSFIHRASVLGSIRVPGKSYVSCLEVNALGWNYAVAVGEAARISNSSLVGAKQYDQDEARKIRPPPRMAKAHALRMKAFALRKDDE